MYAFIFIMFVEVDGNSFEVSGLFKKIVKLYVVVKVSVVAVLRWDMFFK